MRVNNNGDEVEETNLFPYAGACWVNPTNEDRDAALALLCERLNVEVWKTNATKHGNVGYELRERDA